ncbi:MAG: peptide ABC transporter permease [Hyphomicrobiales bacterium]|nr:MAG: peptide ABC transporter permease [Hyphomicrobiales bacterium]
MSEFDFQGERETWGDLGRKALRNRSFFIGALITGSVLFMALLSFFWTPFDVTALDIPNKLHWPDAVNWLGTDHFGRDVFSMLMVGARNSIAVAIVAVSIGMAIGVPLGAAAAASRSWGSDVIMRTNDFIFAFPSLLLAVLFTAIFGPSAINAMIAIGIFNIPVFARLAHGGSLALWQREFILSAQTSGKSRVRITVEHIMPNLLNILIVQGTIQFSLGILIEAGLSYLGLGTQPPDPSWGKMLSEAQTMMYFASYLAIFPGIAIVFAVLGLNLLGDGLRDIFDPKLRRGR